MKKNLYSIILLLFCTILKAQVTVVATGGTNSTYSNLNAAFYAISNGQHTGVINITITSDFSIFTTAVLDSSGNSTGSLYSSITISPLSGTNPVISGLTSTPMDLIWFNGADNVTIDGISRNGNTSLTISNANIEDGASTLAFTDGATNNMVRNTKIKGALGTYYRGVVSFLHGTGAVGNSYNTIENCDIDGSGTATIGIYSYQESSVTTLKNIYNTVKNCNIYDCFTPSLGSSFGILLDFGNAYWQVRDNNIYQTNNRTVSTQGTHFGMYDVSFGNNTYKKNYIGGNAPLCSGTMSYTASAVAVGFTGLYIQTDLADNVIDSNVVKNVNTTWSLSGGSFLNVGINIYASSASTVANITNNEVSNLNFTNSTGSAVASGLLLEGRIVSAIPEMNAVFNVVNNKIFNIGLSKGGTGSAQFIGIRLETSSSYSLALTNAAISSPVFNVSNCTIRDITATTTNGTSSYIRGIMNVNTQGVSGSAAILSPKANIENNIIQNFNCHSNLASYTSPSVAGVYFIASNVTTRNDTVVISKNQINNLNGTNTANIASSVCGIYATSGNFRILSNRIFGITNASSGSSSIPVINGIVIRQTTQSYSLVANNQIALGSTVTTLASIYGIINNFTNGSTIGWNIYNNSVLISGSSTGNRNSAAFYRGTETATTITTNVDVSNNLFINNRTSTSGVNAAIASYSTSNWKGNNNALLANNVANIALLATSASNFSNWKSNMSADKYAVCLGVSSNSQLSSSTPTVAIADLFSNANPATTGDLNIKIDNAAAWIVAGAGRSATFVSKDFNDNMRNTNMGMAVCIGSHQFVPLSTPPDAVETGSFSNGGTTTYTLFNKVLGSIFWTNTGTITSRNFKFYSGINPSNTAQTYSNGYWEVSVNNDAVGHNYNINFNYDSSFIGTATNSALTRISKTNANNEFVLIANSSANNSTMIASANNLSSFSKFALTNSSNALPVELASFYAEKREKANVIIWETKSESNNKGFWLTKSLDGNVFEEIDFIPSLISNGNSNITLKYEYLDNNIQNNIVYYQLKQVDNDNQINLSRIIAVKRDNDNELAIYPNPTKGFLTIETDNIGNNTELIITNINGSIMLKQIISGGKQDIDISSFPEGLYLMMLNNNVYKIVKN